MILVTGASGAVGPAIVRALCEKKCKVRALCRNLPLKGVLPDDVEIHRGDVTKPIDVASAMKDVKAVIHLAALLHIVNPPDHLRDHYEKINVGGTKTVVDVAVTAKVERVLFFSSIAVYGKTEGKIVSEETLPNPDTLYGQTKLEAERIVLAARNSIDQPIGTVLRIAAVYGARIKGNYLQLLMALARGRFLPIGQGRNRRTLIYDKDIANAAILALQHPAAAGRIYNVSDGQYHPLVEIITAMCKALGRKTPSFSLPLAPVRFIAGILEDAAGVAGFKSPIVRSTIDKYSEDIAVDSRLFQKELGFTTKFDLTTGWQDAVQEMRRVGSL